MFLVLLALVAAPPGWAGEPVSVEPVVSLAPDALTRYDAVRTALVDDKLDAVLTAARELATSAAGDTALAESATAVATAQDLGSARIAFGGLSRLLIARVASTSPVPKVVVYHCSMFEHFAWWIQLKTGIANPYMGQAMPECGEEKSLKSAVKAAAAA